MAKRKALVLFSGGMDSILAAEILNRQKIGVSLICFKSYFFDCDLAKELSGDPRLKIFDFSKDHLKVVKSPECGRGKGMNPCMDCHLLMLKKAKEEMIKKEYDFIATGDVLSERPFSQNMPSLLRMDKEAGLAGKILRPLSAKLLPETEAEKRGFVKRDDLFGISGKSRKPQLKLAKEFKIKKVPNPAGGCILCDLNYSENLKKLFEKNPKADGKDCLALRRGRVLWKKNFLIIVGRDEKEDKKLVMLKKTGDMILTPHNFTGPTALIRSFGKRIREEEIKEAAGYLINYSKRLPKEIKISLSEI